MSSLSPARRKQRPRVLGCSRSLLQVSKVTALPPVLTCSQPLTQKARQEALSNDPWQGTALRCANQWWVEGESDGRMLIVIEKAARPAWLSG